MKNLMTRMKSGLVVITAVALGGCSSLLGDFAYDENPPRNPFDGTPAGSKIVVTPVTGLVTTESGGKATFTVVLAQEPKSQVFINLESSNPKEGSLSQQTLSFTKDNFAAPQVVQITGVDDDKEDGPQSYKIITSLATSEDKDFRGLDPADVEVTNTDNDTAGVMITPPGGLVTSESGMEATFTIQLNKQPDADVTVPLSSSKETEGTVSPTLVTFTPLNWMAPQVVTVTGVDDDVKDGEQAYLVVTDKTQSTDAKYSGLDVPDVSVTNQDNDTAGIVLTPATGLMTYENGLMTSLSIALRSPPSGKVIIALSSSDDSEGEVSPASVTFTPDNWMAPQVVSVTGKDDTSIDGDQPYQVQTKIDAATEDQDYLNLKTPPKADVVNVDDDFARIVVELTSAMSTSEDLDAVTFSVRLLAKPNGTVKLDVSSLRPEEGVVTPALLTFNPENWAGPQTVTVTGVDDEVADGPQAYTVRVKPNPETADERYAGLLEEDIMLSNIDNDSAGFRLRPQPLPVLLTTESGGTATFTLELTSKPRATVTIPLNTSDDSEGTVTPNQLVFTTENYKSPQTVTVRGVNDPRQDGDQPFRIITQMPKTDDADYAKLDPPNVDCRNVDDDTAGITVKPLGKTLVTAENGQTATFTVELNSEPKKEVTLTLDSTDKLEGTVSPTTLKFTATNWKAPQTVTVKGQQDSVNDGDREYFVRFGPVQSEDPEYGTDPQKLRPLDVRCSNVDDDSPFIRVINYNNLTTSERAGMAPATFQVALGSQPRAPVSISVSSSRTTEGTVSPSTLQFNAVNWSSPQTITVSGVDERVADGPQQFLVVFAPSTSNDGDYQGRLPNPSTITVINQDDDSPGVLVKAAANLATSEPSETATFTVELTSQPTADVTIPLFSSNTKEGTVSPASITFTPSNWGAARTVTLTGVDDKVQDGNQPYVVTVGPSTSKDPNYNPRPATEVKVTNEDDDIAKILVGAVTGRASEDGTSASFTIRLQTQPTADVKIGVSSTRVGELTVNPASVTFTAVNWASPQTITVTGVNDDMQDDDQPVLIDVGAPMTSDGNYKAIDPPDVTVTNYDNDAAGIVVKQISTQTSESGVTASFTVALRTQPSGKADVTLTMMSSDTSEGTLSTGTLTFTDANWKSEQVVTVTGVDDDSTADGPQRFTVSFGASKSDDRNYKGLQPQTLNFTNLDNDSAGIEVKPTVGETSEDLETMSFTVALLSKPKANVKIDVVSSDPGEGTVSASALTFTPENWSARQTVTVTGVDDEEDDGSATYKVTLGPPTSTDTAYAELVLPSVNLTNKDNDVAEVVVSQAEGNTTEAGGKTRFTIKLRTKPSADVKISLSSSNNAEGYAMQKEVTLTPSDWNTPHGVDVFGEDDEVQDGDQVYTIITGAASSKDDNYDGKSVADVTVKNIDDDTAGFTVGPATGHTSEDGDKATFTIRLNSKPTAAVSIPIKSNNEAEGTVAVETVNFTVNNWNVAQTVTVTGVDDDVADGNVEYTIVLDKPMTTDVNYAKANPDDVTFTNDDNDSAAFLVTMPASTQTGEAEAAPSVTFQVALSSKPKGNVSIELKSSNPTEGDITSPEDKVLTFTPNNWSTKQPVVVKGVDDEVVDGDKTYQITFGPPKSSDGGYNTLPAQKVSLENADDDVAPPPDPEPEPE